MSFPHNLLREIYSDQCTPNHIKRMIRKNLEAEEVDYKGCRMLVHPSDNNTEFQIWRMGRTHEERAIRNILGEISDKPFIAFDVGANAGSFSLRLGAVAPAGSQIHAFEPNPQMRKRLEYNLSLNGLDNVQVHDCAISDDFGRMELFVPDKSNLGQARLGSPFEDGEKILVEVCPLTHFLPENGAAEIDFLKIDIEGFEDRALMPLLTGVPFEFCPKLIFFEHKHNSIWQVDIVSELKRFGYQMKKEYGRNALFEKRPS